MFDGPRLRRSLVRSLAARFPCYKWGELARRLSQRGSVGSLRSHDADGNENVKKTIGFISKTKTLHVHHAFLYISLPFLNDYDVKMPNFAFYGGHKQATT